jgi:SAM-dependent methyltransferase
VKSPTSLESSPQGDERTPSDEGALYDVFFERFDYGLDYYLGLARTAGGPVLDIACGTGRVLLPCLQSGIDVDGLDLSAAMLDRLREKAAALGLGPTLHEASMSAFRLPRRYALIMIPFNAFVHNLVTDDQWDRGCRGHLGRWEAGLRHFFPGRP